MSKLTDSTNDTKQFVAIGKFTSPHGIKGDIKIYSYNDIKSLIDNECFDINKNRFELNIKSSKGNIAIASIKNNNDRNSAEVLRDKEIFIFIEPIIESNTFYFKDLIGMSVKSDKQSEIGLITSVENFGASDLIEITFKNGKSDLFSFDKNTFIEINLKERFVIFTPPEII
jgi:16S rRNA processing protein RimM